MDKQSEIIIAAQKLFSQFGLKKVTTDDVAKEAKVSKATIYKHYKNKQEIFREVVQVETNQMLTAIYDAIDHEFSVEGKLKVFLMTKIDKIHNLINFYRVTHDTWGEHWPYIKDVHEVFMQKEKEIFRDILRMGNDVGELNVHDIDLQSHILAISLKSIEYPWAVAYQEVTIKEIVDLIIETFLNGVRKR
ncbi:MAG: TetR/AcrR family transcriptional regulator [Candidatus Electryonea clarkiae]|nr:TetR/AcrR family transcriptional regulator [Candidatus Electryonea clarkiae]